MRKIIDSNQLQSNNLREYLAKSNTNYAVLSDYAAMEAYKGDTLESIYKSMEILCDYPDQVIILKNTPIVCGLNGSGSGLQKRLIDSKLSSEFGDYARQLKMAKNGNLKLKNQLVAHGHEASAHLSRMLDDAKAIATTFDNVAKQYSKKERAVIRSGAPYPSGMVSKTHETVLQIASGLFRTHPQVKVFPNHTDLPNTFIFRASLCMYLLALEWAANGGAKDASPIKLRNDMVDVFFCTYATYFDGVMSNDAKVIRLHRETRIWLSGLFACHLHGRAI